MLTGAIQLSNQAIRTTSATQKAPLGSIGITRDGRMFRYAKGGAADIVAGNALVAPTVVANHQNCAVAAAAAVGDRVVKVTLGATASTLNQYKDGFLTVRDNAGEGYIYQIAGNTVGNASTIYVYLVDPIEVALTVASEVSLMYNNYANVVISVTDQADAPAGIAHCAVDVSEEPYFWVQTGGHSPVWADEAFAIGSGLTTGTGTAGQLEAVDAVAEPYWGDAVQAGVDGETTIAWLKLN